MIDLHSATLSVDGVAVPVVSGRVTVDESWAPYVQADVTIPLADAPDAIDPRDGDRAILELRRDFGTRWSNADFTAAHPAPTTGAALTAAYGGQPASVITGRFGQPFASAGTRTSDVRTLALGVRSRTVDHVAQEIRIRLASDEAVMQDYARIATTAYRNLFTTLRGAVFDALGYIGASLEPGTFDAPLTVQEAEWLPGVSAWDYLSPLVEKADGRLWADESGRWRLTPRGDMAPGQLTLTTGENGSLVSATDTIDRSGDDWADAVVITYRWTDAAGATQTAYDTAGEAYTARKVLSLERAQPFPGAGAAAAILRRAQDRGRVLSLGAVNDYTATPGQAFMASLPGTPALTGVVSAISWDIGNNYEMAVTTRGLIDTPATAWTFQPAGRTWNSIPAGIDWTEVA